MVDIPDSLRSVFSATVHERDGTYVIDIPSRAINHDILTSEETYRVALLDLPTPTESPNQRSPRADRPQTSRRRQDQSPPVNEGEIRDVTIETVGNQGDGIAKVERGYVVIIPGVQPGDEPTVEIEQVQENVAFASVVDSDSRVL